jgi:F-type H+-transporting ATPase subunit gamma
MIEREVTRVGYVVVSSDRGLCGGLNTNLFKALVKDMASNREQGVEVDLCVIGTKGAAFFRSFGGNVVAAISHLGEEPSINDLIGSVKVMLDAYLEGRIDRLSVVSNKFINTMTQKPTV